MLVPTPPKWLDHRLAGYAFASDPRHSPVAIHDPKTGYYLIRSEDGKGSFLQLILTHDRKLVDGLSIHDSYDAKGKDRIRWCHIHSMATGRGVRIGDSQAAVRARLGKPSTITRIDKRHHFVEFDYIWAPTKGVEISETYTFNRKGLKQIEFTRTNSDY